MIMQLEDSRYLLSTTFTLVEADAIPQSVLNERTAKKEGHRTNSADRPAKKSMAAHAASANG